MGKRIFQSLVLLCIPVLTSCTTLRDYPSQIAPIHQEYAYGQYAAAAQKIEKAAKKRGKSPDRLLWYLEEGAIKRAKGDYIASNQAFEKAETVLNDFDNRATISTRGVAAEAAAALTNLNALPYTGYAYDRIMVNTYKCLNYLALGQLAEAKVEILRAYEEQKQALERYQKQIAEAEISSAKQGVKSSAINNDSRFQQSFAKNYSEIQKLKIYADYVNPLTSYLDGILFYASGISGADLERARKDWERVSEMIGNNDYVIQDINEVSAKISGQPREPIVYVLFENGLGPIRDEIRIDLPIFAQNITYVGAAFPTLKFNPPTIKSLIIESDEQEQYETVLLANMDAIVAQEFDNQLKLTIIKTLIASTLKATMQYQLEKEVGPIGKYSAALYSFITNRADQRSWTSLPKEIQFARFQKPKRNWLTLRNGYNQSQVKVELPEGNIILIYVKAPRGFETMTYNTMVLR